MFNVNDIEVNPENEWRLEGTEPSGWAKTVKPHDSNKYFMVSCDTHLTPPPTLFQDRLDKKWLDLLPRYEIRDGKKYLYMPGRGEPERIITVDFQGEDLARQKAGALAHMGDCEDSISWKRIHEQEADGVDAEVLYGNGQALLMWASDNNEFVQAKCEVWNNWAWEVCGDFAHRSSPAATIMTAEVDIAVKEVERVAKMGYKILSFPCKPIYGPEDTKHPNYNLSMYDPLWAAIQEADLTVTYHSFTGMDTRTARSYGSVVINNVCHSITPMSPIVHMCASGVFEKFPNLRVAAIEGDAGWVPWMMQRMDEAYIKQHFWAFPKLKELPSQYFKNNCYVSFGEDRAVISLAEEFDIVDNLMWANDYPHHEGTWPRSEQAIYRTLGDKLSEESRAKVLGLNAAKCFGFDIPEKYR